MAAEETEKNTKRENELKALTETKISGAVVYEGSFLKVIKDQVRLPDGTTSTREFIPHPGASVIIPVTADGKLIFVRQFRYPLKQVFIEFPAGKIDSGEDPLNTAKRELVEETGYAAANYRHLMTIHPTIGYANETMYIYLATGLTAGKQELDEGEFVEVFEMTLQEALELMRKGELTDVKTMVSLFWYQQVVNTNW